MKRSFTAFVISVLFLFLVAIIGLFLKSSVFRDQFVGQWQIAIPKSTSEETIKLRISKKDGLYLIDYMVNGVWTFEKLKNESDGWANGVNLQYLYSYQREGDILINPRNFGSNIYYNSTSGMLQTEVGWFKRE